MTLELKPYSYWAIANPKPYRLFGVQRITKRTEYGIGHFSITIFDTRMFCTDMFEYVRDVDTDEYFVKDGKWIKTD